jgi:hypothetical protein
MRNYSFKGIIPKNDRGGKMRKRYVILGLLLLGSLTLMVKRQNRGITPIKNANENISTEAAELAGSFKCQGKVRCPEMTSCSEAKFYLSTCPNVEIDGDGDGIPCEDQLCGN